MPRSSRRAGRSRDDVVVRSFDAIPPLDKTRLMRYGPHQRATATIGDAAPFLEFRLLHVSTVKLLLLLAAELRTASCPSLLLRCRRECSSTSARSTSKSSTRGIETAVEYLLISCESSRRKSIAPRSCRLELSERINVVAVFSSPGGVRHMSCSCVRTRRTSLQRMRRR